MTARDVAWMFASIWLAALLIVDGSKTAILILAGLSMLNAWAASYAAWKRGKETIK